MKLELWLIGKNESYITEGFSVFEKRTARYIGFETKYFANDRKGKTPELIKSAESKLVLGKLEPKDYLIILDERGKKFTSQKFAALINSIMTGGKKKAVFLVGGAYGFDEPLRSRADLVLSLSDMTFSHQVVRLLFMEQIYRAFTIINNEPYHHA